MKVVQPYLFFNGRCEEALTFYKRTLGAEVVFLQRFRDAPDPSMAPEGAANKIMHATFRIGEDNLMASDGQCSGRTSFEGFSMSISVDSMAEAQPIFDALAEGGTMRMPMAKTSWSEGFGMVTDRFGLNWMVNCAAHNKVA